MKMGGDEELEKTVHLWFIQKREDGVPITGLILQAKARDLFQKISYKSIHSINWLGMEVLQTP